MIDNFETLSNGIIAQASNDYIKASVNLRLYKKRPDSEKYMAADKMMDDVVEFFRSEYFLYLAPDGIDVDKFLDMLDKQSDIEYSKELKRLAEKFKSKNN